jgi:hypothetical protein
MFATLCEMESREATEEEHVQQGGEEEEEKALAIWCALQGSLDVTTSPGGAGVVLDDVLAALRGSSTSSAIPPATTTTAPAFDLLEEAERSVQREEEGLEDVWWWLFASQGDNACLAFLDDDDEHDDDDHLDDEDDQHQNQHQQQQLHRGREEVFLALAPAVLDRLLQQAVHHDALAKVCARLGTESALVWRRVKQACGARRHRRRRETTQDCHSDLHHHNNKDDDDDEDYRQAELVGVLLRCLRAGDRPDEEESVILEQVVLQHTNVALVLGIPPPLSHHDKHVRSHEASLDAHAISHAHAHTEGIDYLLVENDPDSDLLAKLFTHQDERVREAVIASLLSNSDLDFKVWRPLYLLVRARVYACASALQHH